MFLVTLHRFYEGRQSGNLKGSFIDGKYFHNLHRMKDFRCCRGFVYAWAR